MSGADVTGGVGPVRVFAPVSRVTSPMDERIDVVLDLLAEPFTVTGFSTPSRTSQVPERPSGRWMTRIVSVSTASKRSATLVFAWLIPAGIILSIPICRKIHGRNHWPAVGDAKHIQWPHRINLLLWRLPLHALGGIPRQEPGVLARDIRRSPPVCSYVIGRDVQHTFYPQCPMQEFLHPSVSFALLAVARRSVEHMRLTPDCLRRYFSVCGRRYEDIPVKRRQQRPITAVNVLEESRSSIWL